MDERNRGTLTIMTTMTRRRTICFHIEVIGETAEIVIGGEGSYCGHCGHCSHCTKWYDVGADYKKWRERAPHNFVFVVFNDLKLVLDGKPNGIWHRFCEFIFFCNFCCILIVRENEGEMRRDGECTKLGLRTGLSKELSADRGGAKR